MIVNYCQAVTPVFTNEVVNVVGGGFIGETRKRVLTRSIEHQEDSMAGKWEASGATEHSKECHGWFNWLHPKTLAKLSNIHERKIRESSEIYNLETKAEYVKSIKVGTSVTSFRD